MHYIYTHTLIYTHNKSLHIYYDAKILNNKKQMAMVSFYAILLKYFYCVQ